MSSTRAAPLRGNPASCSNVSAIVVVSRQAARRHRDRGKPPLAGGDERGEPPINSGQMGCTFRMRATRNYSQPVENVQ
jgi:hypothetical protein